MPALLLLLLVVVVEVWDVEPLDEMVEEEEVDDGVEEGEDFDFSF